MLVALESPNYYSHFNSLSPGRYGVDFICAIIVIYIFMIAIVTVPSGVTLRRISQDLTYDYSTLV